MKNCEVQNSHTASAWSGYPAYAPPVFFRRYLLPGNLPPVAVAINAACLDYSVATDGGTLVAYRWDGEREIDAGKFVAEARFTSVGVAGISTDNVNRSLAGTAAEC